MNLITGNEKVTMTSLEIAELMNKNHGHVIRDIKLLIEQGAIGASKSGLSSYVSAQNKELPMYLLDFTSTMILITGYDAVRRAIVIKRWQELENKHQKDLLPQDYPTALRMLANEVEQKQLALSQRDEAIRTKALIGNKREATAMATASVAVREKNRLEDELGRGTNWKAAKAIPWVKEYLSLSKGMWIQFGKKLKSISDEIGIPAIKIESDRFGQVNAYHVDVIEKLRCRLEADDNMLCKYRIEEATA